MNKPSLTLVDIINMIKIYFEIYGFLLVTRKRGYERIVDILILKSNLITSESLFTSMNYNICINVMYYKRIINVKCLYYQDLLLKQTI